MSLADLRLEYSRASLTEADVDPDPIVQFNAWFEAAQRAQIQEPNAMCLATCTPDGFPSARIVLLKGVDSRGFAFYTDYRSRKGEELAANPRAALCFHWQELERQVRITGTANRVDHAEAESYFQSRPLGSRIGAWASTQSHELDSRETLERRVNELSAQFAGGVVPLPAHWGGFRVVPAEIEFWQGRPSRLHDRIRFVRTPDGWARSRLSP